MENAHEIPTSEVLEEFREDFKDLIVAMKAIGTKIPEGSFLGKVQRHIAAMEDYTDAELDQMTEIVINLEEEEVLGQKD